MVLTAAVAVLGLSAFTLSFDALRYLAVAAGVNGRLAWLWPLIVDGFICVATVAAVLLRPRGWRIAWYPWATLTAAAFVSVSGNALHARTHADLTVVSLSTAALVSAVPAIALLLASHMLVVLLAPPSQRSVSASAHRVAPVSTLQSSRSGVDSRPGGGAGSQRPTAEELRAWIEAVTTSGSAVTGAMVAEHFGVSSATGRRWLQAVRRTEGATLSPASAVSGVREYVPDGSVVNAASNGAHRAEAPP
ncbi:DUF2637 domain-containing protein [Phytoactinopolyspora halotolerans]|uniref:DUF2637 domain-containing protein n=1 Tax=Phytoactinopolyspora halotolerans TaxID=1981512 RepID=A0A6L9S7U5_9ACTN|nr:DUF2637 domain-containing protein [Phytoactinopolyspora halotolerans]NEE01179.1 DUF2637 domain-containing protein [Phytoactinopolyspora halotolerans]